MSWMRRMPEGPRPTLSAATSISVWGSAGGSVFVDQAVDASSVAVRPPRIAHPDGRAGGIQGRHDGEGAVQRDER